MELGPELTPPAVTRLPARRRMNLCPACMALFSAAVTKCSCGEVNLVPYLDQRPLWLDDDAMRAAMGLLDEILERVNTSLEIDLDELQSLTTDYLPWLTRLLKDSEVAGQRKANGEFGFRTTNLSTDEILKALREQRDPE
jgi:hypothetical protein